MTDSSVGYSLDTHLKIQGVIGEQDLTDRHLTLQDDEVLHSSTDSDSEEDVTEALQDNVTTQQQPEQVFYHVPTTTTTTAAAAAVTRMRSRSNVIPPHLSQQDPSILPPQAQRIWEMDRVTPQCRRCDRQFTFLVRRHHCRRCGQIICDKCSLHRMQLPIDELVEDPMVSRAQYTYLATQPQRVCDTCFSIPVRRASSALQRSNSLQSLLLDCPVCGYHFLGLSQEEQEGHLEQCLNMDGSAMHTPRYIVIKVYKL
ncbi:FYVE-domain-containing protein, partial [Backusella circina FSU 941]